VSGPRVLVAPDKFKGSLTAAQVADALADGLTRAGVEAQKLPLADGGDGSVDAAWPRASGGCP
jgi:glycerate 2-kinase